MEAHAKLVVGYWDIRGLVQPIKYLLEYLQVEYEDKRYFYGEAPDFNRDSWFSVKQSLGFPLPNLPYMIDGDLKLTESHAIYRYLCGKYRPELLGKTLEDRAHVDMVMSHAQDIRNASYNACYETGDRAFVRAMALERFGPLARFLGDHKPFIVGEYVTYPDFFLYEQIELFDFICENELVKKYPNLESYRQRVAALPNLKEYLASERCIKRPFNGKRAKINN